MKKNLQFLFLAAIFAGSTATIAQTQDIAPNTNTGTFAHSGDRTGFNMQFQFGIGANSPASVGYNGLAGVALINNEFWVSQWSTNRIIVLNFDGTLKVDTVVAGVTGTRSITYDGTSVYFGGAGTAIYKVDPATYTLQSTITISTVSNAESRMCTYDATLDGGNGGFWVGDFGSDIASVDMNGLEISVIPAATHGLTIYGGTIDNESTDGPWLWIHDQTGVAPNQSNIVQLDPATGAPTGVSYDYFDNALPNTTGALAGGLFLSTEAVPGTISLVGLSQTTPDNQLFSLEITSSASIETSNALELEIYPNPASDIVRLATTESGPLNVEVVDISGKLIFAKDIYNAQMDVSELNSGIYLIKVNQNGNTITKKLVVQ